MAGWWQASDAELLAVLDKTNREHNTTYLRLLEVIGEVSTRALSGKEGFGTDVDLLRCAQNITCPEAERRIAAARDALPGRTTTGMATPSALPETGKAVAERVVSADHIAAIQRTLAALPTHLDAYRAYVVGPRCVTQHPGRHRVGEHGAFHGVVLLIVADLPGSVPGTRASTPIGTRTSHFSDVAAHLRNTRTKRSDRMRLCRNGVEETEVDAHPAQMCRKIREPREGLSCAELPFASTGEEWCRCRSCSLAAHRRFRRGSVAPFVGIEVRRWRRECRTVGQAGNKPGFCAERRDLTSASSERVPRPARRPCRPGGLNGVSQGPDPAQDQLASVPDQ